MTISLSDNDPRISYSVSQGVTQTTFTVPFEFFDLDDLNVYVDGTQKTKTTHYTLASGGSGSTGSITMSVTGATGGSTVVITRDIDHERTTDFQTSGPFNIASLNTELDRFTAIAADLQDGIDRSLRLTDFDAAASLVLPDVNTRKGKTLAFNASSGAVESGPSISDVQTVSAAAADIATLADIEDGTDATNAIQTVAGVQANVTTVAGIASNVTTVAGISSNVSTVAGNNSNISTVAGNNTNISTVAGISSNVTTVAGIASDVSAVAADATDIGAVAGKATEIGRLGTTAAVADLALLGTSDAVSDMNTLAAISSNISTAAGISSNITTVAGIASNITAVAGDATDIGAVAAKATEIGRLGTTAAVADLAILGTSDAVSDMNTLAAISSNISTAAGISSNITTVAGISSNVTAAAGKATEIGRLGTAAAVADLAILGTTDAVADMNTLAAISSDITSLAGALEKTYTVTVTNPGSGNVFVLDGSNNPTISMFRGNTYIFDQSDSSNAGHPIAFKDSGGSAYTTGVTSTGTPGNAGAKTTIEVASDAPSSLRYYCTVHGNAMGNTITVTDSNISLVATNITNVNLTGGSITNVNSVAGAISNVNTVATNLSSINDFADKYRIGASDPTSNNDEGDLFYNTTSNTLKVYTGSAFEAGVTAGSGFAALTGASFTGAVDVDNTLTANTIALDNGSNDWSVTVTSNNLIFSYAGTAKMKLDSSGNLTVTGDVISEGTI